MHTPVYWLGQYLLAAITMFLLLAGVELLRGGGVASWPATLGWSCSAAAIFTASRYRRAKRVQACSLCGDTKRPG